MLGFILFIRTLAVGLIFLVSSLVIGIVIIHILRYFKLISSLTTEGIITLVIVITSWILYRRFFQQYLYLDDDEKS